MPAPFGWAWHMTTDWPRITIVTPSFNQADFLEETLVSVLSQDYPNLEYIVIDGGSTDGSVAILETYSDRLTDWVSEPDRGQTDAIAKGFEMATGEIINWLNSDDLLLPGALSAVARTFMSTGADVVVGQDRHFYESHHHPVRRFIPSGYSYPECLRFWSGEFRYHQPCTFFTRAVYNDAGGLDRELNFSMDYDLYCRILAREGVTVEYLEEELSAFRLHKDSKTSKNAPDQLRDLAQASQRYWPDEFRSDPKTARDLKAFVAKCQVHQIVAALRKGDAGAALRSVKVLGCARPFHAIAYACSLIAKKRPV